MKSKMLPRETVGSRLDDLSIQLENMSDTPGLDAQVLLAHVLDRPRSQVLAHPEAVLTRKRSAALDGLVARLNDGEPLPYVLGKWEFFGLEFGLTPDVLIPRPETELLVEKAIGWLNRFPECRQVADIGTGSGCIAIALAVNVPDVHVLATDISSAAVSIARRNAKKHGVADRVECVCSDLLPADHGCFHLIAANLPYIPTNTLHELSIFGREPTLALDGGADGLNLIRRLLTQVPERLESGGFLLLEIEALQGPQALSLAYDAFAEADIDLHTDGSGRNRLLEVRLK